MKRIMIDIETLSTESNAAVLSIGVAEFSPAQGVIASGGWSINTSLVAGHIDPKTVAWWMKQSKPARDFSFADAPNCFAPAEVARALVPWLAGADEVWAKDPDFDLVILKSWWTGLELAPWPVKFWATRSVRTIVAIGDALKLNFKQPAVTAHNPVEDACSQAREVAVILKHLGVP